MFIEHLKINVRRSLILDSLPSKFRLSAIVSPENVQRVSISNHIGLTVEAKERVTVSSA